MLIIRCYLLFDEIQVVSQSTRLSVVNPAGKLIMPTLDYVAHATDEEHSPQDFLEAMSHMVDNIDHGPHQGLWHHLSL